MKKGWTGYKLSVWLLCGWCGLAASSPAATTLAILAGDGADAQTEAVVARLEVACSKVTDLALVERALIRKVLDEQALAAGGLTASNGVVLGRLLAAELLLFAERAPTTTNAPAWRVQAVESATSVTLGTWVESEDALIQKDPAIVRFVRATLAKRAIPASDRHYVGVLGLRSEEAGRQLDDFVRALEFLVTTDLGLSPHVVVLERAHLDRLRQEHELTGIEQQIKASAFLLEGGIRHAPERDRLEATVLLRPLAGGTPLQATRALDAGDVKQARQTMAQALTELLRVKPSETATTEPDAIKEAAIYARQASQWLTWRYPEQAASAAGAAYALDPSQSNQLLLAYVLHWQSSLDSILRSKELMLDYYDRYLKAVEVGAEKLRELPFFGFEGIAPFSTTDSAATTALKEDIMRLEDDLFRRRLSHYRANYDATRSWNPPFKANAYWGTWSARVSALSSYYPGRPEKQAALVREAVEAFCGTIPSQYKKMDVTRLNMLIELPWMMKSGERNPHEQEVFVVLFRDLARHRDPWVRLMANMSLYALKDDPVNTFLASYAILAHELPPEHPYRSDDFSERAVFFFELGYKWFPPPKRKLPPAAREQLFDYQTQIIDAALKDKNVRHIEAMAGLSRDTSVTLERWLNYMIEQGAVTRADALAERITAVVNEREMEIGKKLDLLESLKKCRQRCATLRGQTPVATQVPANDDAWKAYQITRLDIPLNSTWRLLVSDDRLYHVEVKHSSETHYDAASNRILMMQAVAFIYQLPSGDRLRKTTFVCRKLLRSYRINGMVLCDSKLYVGTFDGLIVFSLMDRSAWRISDTNGLPGNAVRAVCAWSNMLYLSGGGQDNYSREESAWLVAHDPQADTWRLLASERAVDKRNEFDGNAFNVTVMMADEREQAIWLVDHSARVGRTPTLNYGLWKLIPADERFQPINLSAALPFLNALIQDNIMALNPPQHTVERGFVEALLRALSSTPADRYKLGEISKNIPDGPCLTFAEGFYYGHPPLDTFCLYAANKPYALLNQSPDGKPFPKVAWFARVEHGCLVVGEDKSVYLIQKKP